MYSVAIIVVEGLRLKVVIRASAFAITRDSFPRIWRENRPSWPGYGRPQVADRRRNWASSIEDQV